ncbi:MAG: type II secretion system minor pseudopilin GspK [Rhodocyclaceae bacterium]|nr:type II secretion system minor pseudopilin GspK [Rhodocyclaceae bacterium]MCA3019342.1 type II secretion system minor pseudopilin GspK [Rhodocyclaceae bacterium]MCA3025548.1 type II secretion system minor pseudopilin GspK [Rhodocyclaceae bacterium]MCA3027443.1 type II secretion system minor pseudopilin GspK [Rhodocyclaceae bacterium]MCA3033082.1 type II secretion system minor pseudopilin GspK [Rhodocyclaceae bacterium]
MASRAPYRRDRSYASRAHQRGVAIITALLVVMLATTVASYLLAQQAEALSRVERATERAQLGLHATTTLEWARSALVVQQKNSTYVALSQPWAQGLVARPIDTAVATGLLRDAQSKFNINNLVGADGKRREPDVDAFSRLLKILKLDPNIATAVVDWIDRDDDVSTPGGAENNYYWSQAGYGAANRPISQVEELLRVKGIDETTLRKLSPFVTALPTPNGERTRININTTSIEMLQALFADVPAEQLLETIRVRELPFIDAKDIAERRKQLPAAIVELFLDTKSRYFEAALAITGQYSQIRQVALLQLQAGGAGASSIAWPAIIWVKENG